MQNKLIAHKKFSFGKRAVFSKRKVNEIVLEMSLYEDEKGRPVFSVCGEVWNGRHTDIECGGQCIDSIIQYYPPIGHNPLYRKIMGLWERNHLNDMNSSSPRQQIAIDKWIAKGHKYDYDEICDMLKKKRLYKDAKYIHNGKPYVYGTAWLYREIPEEDLKEIRKLLDWHIDLEEEKLLAQ